ncbi:MAG: low molecular weight protein arginine phosphatase [Elusimicrobia bacterium]|nr:low molecular weight protein arginine phosphatase [Elusimicrobiota bacterium]MDE2510829.1 low molecular weight protein arginine phosphatase [Elusimicrobiota bacterium]
MAEKIAQRLAGEAGLPLTAESAGVAAEVGEGMTDEAIRALGKLGIDDKNHVARQLNEAMLESADDVYVMTRSHRSTILSRFPKYAEKIQILLEAAGLGGHDIADPWGHNDAVYSECADLIKESLDILIRRHSHAGNPR